MRVQLHHRLTWQQARSSGLPVELVLETPVIFLTFLFLPPDGWAAVLDDNALPNIAQASQVRLENGDPNLYRESTPVVPTHVPSPATPTHHRSRVCVCVCVCDISLFDQKSIPHYSCNQLSLSSRPFHYPSYTPTPMTPLLYADNHTSPRLITWPHHIPSSPEVSP